MIESIYKEEILERALLKDFGVKLKVDQMIVHDLPLSRTSYAQLFMTPDKNLYCFIEARSNLNLGDVKKLAQKVGIVPDKFLPPNGRKEYFDEVALKKFKQVFPGRTHVNDLDLAYYRTLVPYHPALIQVKEILNGHIYQFDPDAINSWRVNKAFSYRRIKTS